MIAKTKPNEEDVFLVDPDQQPLAEALTQAVSCLRPVSIMDKAYIQTACRHQALLELLTGHLRASDLKAKDRAKTLQTAYRTAQRRNQAIRRLFPQMPPMSQAEALEKIKQTCGDVANTAKTQNLDH